MDILRFKCFGAILAQILACISIWNANVVSICVKEGYVALAHGIACQVIDHKKSQDSTAKSSFDCISTIKDGIVVKDGGIITLECFAKFPIEVDYDGVQPALHFDIVFSKRGISLEIPNKKNTYVASIFLKPEENFVIWSGIYKFHAIGNTEDILTLSVFIEKDSLPFFLPLGPKEMLNGYKDPTEEYLILPCRVQNYYSDVQLFLNFVPVVLDEYSVYDPKVGYILKISEYDDDAELWGEYECFTKMDGQEDRIKVLANEEPEDETEPQTDTKDYGQLKFVSSGNGSSLALCLLPKVPPQGRSPPATFANSEFNNLATSKLKTGCLHNNEERTRSLCPGRKIGKVVNVAKIALIKFLVEPISKLIPFEIDEENEVYEIIRVHENGAIQCGYNRMQYFTGVDGLIYSDYFVAEEMRALVAVQPIITDIEFHPGEVHEFVCKFASYFFVMPVWWTLKFSDGTIQQELVNNSTVKYYEVSKATIQLSCKVTAWNSSEWFESSFDIKMAEPDLTTTTELPTSTESVKLPELISKGEDSVRIYFKSGAENQILPCKATGMPTPSLKWIKYEQENEELNTTVDGNTLLLNFPFVTKDDEGTYICSAQSNTVLIDVKFSVIIEEKNKDDLLLIVVTDAPEESKNDNNDQNQSERNISSGLDEKIIKDYKNSDEFLWLLLFLICIIIFVLVSHWLYCCCCKGTHNIYYVNR